MWVHSCVLCISIHLNVFISCTYVHVSHQVSVLLYIISDVWINLFWYFFPIPLSPFLTLERTYRDTSSSKSIVRGFSMTFESDFFLMMLTIWYGWCMYISWEVHTQWKPSKVDIYLRTLYILASYWHQILSRWTSSYVDIDTVNCSTSIDDIKPRTTGRYKTRTIWPTIQWKRLCEPVTLTLLDKVIHND